MGTLDGKVAIVTGASKGLGRGEALSLAREGARVAVLARGLEGCVAVSREIEALGGEALPLQCDVREVEQVNAAVQAVVDRWGRVDILVNNAQIIYNFHPMEEWTEEELRATWESGFLGSWAFMMACFPHMKAQGGGRIINFVSAAGHGYVFGLLGYGAAKEAIRSLSKTAAREWGQHNITVNMISPMAMSDSVEKAFPTREAQLGILRNSAAVLVDRWGEAERDIGRAVVYLAGPDAEIMTGCLLSLDNGSAML
jgi:NAD(P)-dependent dehydrogenase (short-subunit alcohol dehydrogenase family)